jgi:hypothetical protein
VGSNRTMENRQGQTLKSWITGDIFTAPLPEITLEAWEPWGDTRLILFELQNSDIDEEHYEWRLHWVAGVALLRTVGHVLRNVDALTSSKHRRSIDKAWTDWQQNKDDNWIFFDFIEKERNNILKEYSFGAALPAAMDGRTLAYGSTEFDATELFREAVYWWRTQLLAFEAQLKNDP